MNAPTNNNGEGPVKSEFQKSARDEAREDLEEFNATCRNVRDLLSYKKSLLEMEFADQEKIKEIRRKAIEAIDNLFNEIISADRKVQA